MKQVQQAFVKASRTIFNEHNGLDACYLFYFALAARDRLRMAGYDVGIEDVFPRYSEVLAIMSKPVKLKLEIIDDFIDEFVSQLYC